MKTPHTALLLSTLFATLLAACAPLAPRPGNATGTTLAGVRWHPSPNYDHRRPNLVIIHHTSNATSAQALRTLTTPERKVSAHYLIDRDGTIVQLVSESDRAWHAGLSWWGGITDVNSASLGIELDNTGSEPFADAQIDALLALLTDIRQRYPIPTANFIGHGDVAPARKADPSPLFPWARLAAAGFGLWCDTAQPPAPEGFDLTLALAALGYDPATPDAAQRAFRDHYLGGDEAPSAEHENAVAYCLLQKKIGE
jgi:N-acetylmuramoyl-L-alanine amidase